MASEVPAPASDGQRPPAEQQPHHLGSQRTRPSKKLSSVGESCEIRVAARVRPEVRAVSRVRSEEGFPYADAERLKALSMEDAARANIECKTDPAERIQSCLMPLSTAARVALLMCRHGRLGTSCPPSMANLPEELWIRIFSSAKMVTVRERARRAHPQALGTPPRWPPVQPVQQHPLRAPRRAPRRLAPADLVRACLASPLLVRARSQLQTLWSWARLPARTPPRA